MVTFRASAEIKSSARQVFATWSDVEGWPQWTASMSEVRRLDDGDLGVGARARVKQPRLPWTEWTVTELVPDRSFTWETGGRGLVTRGRHIVEPQPGGCRVVAELEQRGPLAPVVAALTRRLTQRYLRMELAGLSHRCATSDEV